MTTGSTWPPAMTSDNSPTLLWAVGVGPGDPELITRKAARLIEFADVVAYHRAPHRPSTARNIAADLIPGGAIEEELVYPVTTQISDHPGGYHAAMAAFYLDCAERLAAHLDAGRRVVLLAEGDPLFYGSAMYVYDMLAERFGAEVVPGITSVSASTATLATGLCRHEDVLTVLPGTLPVAELARRLADTDAAVIMKLGRTFPAVVEALRQSGMLERAVYVERASREGERQVAVTDVDPASVPYMSLVVVPGRDRRADAAGRAAGGSSPLDDTRPNAGGAGDTPSSIVARRAMSGPAASSSAASSSLAPSSEPTSSDLASAESASSVSMTPGTVHVVGLGPGPDRWLSPEARDVLATVSHVIGYAPYVARVPHREGLTRLASGNTVEVDRGWQALDLAAAGHDVAVVSGGDAGVFGMATAVFEARETAAAEETGEASAGRAPIQDVSIHVVPGITAAHAASALAGAALGGDHALISLSDRLKPWSVVEARLRACARADMAMAFYNPRSASRPHQFGDAVTVLREEVAGDRVVVVARHVGRAEETLSLTTLGDLDPSSIDMGCLVIIGASSTRVTHDGRAWTPRYVNHA